MGEHKLEVIEETKQELDEETYNEYLTSTKGPRK